MSKQVVEVNDNNFDKEVLESPEPVLVDFWAEWCAPCRMMTPIVDEIAQRYTGKARIAKLNVDHSPIVAQRYGIKGIPTFIAFRNGKEEERIVGATSRDTLTRVIEKNLTAAAA